MLPDLGEFFRLGFGELAELLHHAVGHALADRREHVALLDQLARDIERQIGAVDHEADETQPAGKDVGVLGDEHAAHIKLVAPLARRIEQVERPRARNEGEHRIFVPALGAPMQGQRRLVELAGKAAIEFGVLLLGVTSDLGFAQIAAPSAMRRFSAPSFSMRSIGTATAPEWSRTMRSSVRGWRNSCEASFR